MRPSRAVLPALVVLLVAAFAVRLYGIQTQSLWFDEGWSAYAASRPTLLDAYHADATNPPLYYVLLNAAARSMGESVFALRLVSALLGVLVIPLAYQLGRRLASPRAGVYAALLAAVSPLLWWAAQEARMYTLLAVLVTAAALAWHALRKRPTPRAWLALWGAELALLYAHNTGPVVALWLNVVTVLAWLSSRHLRRPDWRVWLAGQALVALLWSPYFVTRFLLLADANSAVASALELSAATLASVWSAFWAGSWALVGRVSLFSVGSSEPPYLGLSGAALVVALLAIDWRRAPSRWLVSHVAVLAGGLLLGLAVLGNELHGRYLVMVAPLLAVAIGVGLARLNVSLRVVGTGFFAAVLLASIAYSTDPLYGHDDARGMARYYADALTADDTVLAWSYADRYDLAYYWERLGVAARRVTLPEGAGLDAVAPLLPESGDVALNVWYTQRADFRGMLGCVLAHGTSDEPETFTTYGMSTLVYRDPVLTLPDMRPFAADFGAARVDSAGEIPSFTPDQALCIPIALTLQQSVMGDLSAHISVRNTLGWEIARADALFAQPDQRTSSQLAPGDALTAYALLRLPYGAPPGDYPIILRVYDENVPSGYEVTAANGTRGREIQIGVWEAREGADWLQSNRRIDDDDAPIVEVGGLRLTAISSTGTAFYNGDTLPVSLLWEGEGTLPDLTLVDTRGRWREPVPAPEGDVNGVRLDWRNIRIPADAEDGEAELRLVDGRAVLRLTISSLPMLTTAPDYDTPVGTAIPGVGTLVGYQILDDPLTLDAPVPLALVWQAGDDAPADTSFTVFVQLLDADGQLIAQSDSVPHDGERPTTGWRPGEYILDDHALQFNGAAHPGTARLIVGMYDAATGERVRLTDGGDHIALPGTVTVE